MALKLIKNEFINQSESNMKSFEKEITILSGLKHDNITKIIALC